MIEMTMSREQLNALLAELKTNHELREKLKQVADLDAAQTIGSATGFPSAKRSGCNARGSPTPPWS
jgi:predicted ribosomally synthesized peptide with nif11-like leader